MEWISAPESVRLLDIKGPSAWLHSISREQAIDAARQFHRDVCLMTTNLNILEQYVLCLQGTASKILELTLGSRDFPAAAVAAGAMAPRARRASVHSGALCWIQRVVHELFQDSISCGRLLSGPLVGTPEVNLSVILCCIYVGSLIEAGCFGCLRGCVPENYCQFWIFCLLCLCRSVVVLRGGGGGGSTNLWWVGGPSYVLAFFQVTSLCGVTLLINF